MSRIASRNARPASLSEGPSTPVSPAPGKAAQKANGVLLRKQSAGDTPKLSNGTGASQRLAAKLSELLSRYHVSSLIENMPQGMHHKYIQQLLQTCKRPLHCMQYYYAPLTSAGCSQICVLCTAAGPLPSGALLHHAAKHACSPQQCLIGNCIARVTARPHSEDFL